MYGVDKNLSLVSRLLFLQPVGNRLVPVQKDRCKSKTHQDYIIITGAIPPQYIVNRKLIYNLGENIFQVIGLTC